MEQKAIEVYTKAIEDRAVTGIAAVFGNVDSGYDRIFKGAFKKTIKENLGRVKYLWMHDPYQPPTAAIKALKEVSAEDLPDEVRKQHPEVSGGLEVVREYLRTPRGDEVLEGIKAGVISELSFGYDPVKYDFEEIKDGEMKGTQVRNLREVRLWDVSDVTWGMNSLTVASKAAPFLEAYKDTLPGEQFELYAELARMVEVSMAPSQLKEGRVLSARNLLRLKDALTVLSEILLAAEPPVDEESAKALTEEIRAKLNRYESIFNLLVR